MAVDRTLIQIRERSYLEILDLALVVVRRRPLALGLTAALGIAPWAALNYALLSAPTIDDEFRAIDHLLLIVMEAPLATAPLTVVLGGMMFGARPRAGAVVSTLFRQCVPLVLYQAVLRPILLATIFLSWLMPVRLPFLDEVVLLERGKWWKVVTRCSDLTRDRGGDLFGQWVTQVFFGTLFVIACWFAAGQAVDVFRGELTWVRPEWEFLLDARAFAAIWVAVAFFAVVRFLSYIDQRIRLEGWEVELRLRQVGRTMREELQAW